MNLPENSCPDADAPLVHLSGHPVLVQELLEALHGANLSVHASANMRATGGLAEIAVLLGSAGVFTALYKVLDSVLMRHRDRELSIKRNGLSISLKGHGLMEEVELLRQIAPELLRKEPRSRKR